MKSENDIYMKALAVWDQRDQISMFHEEVGELMVALNHYRRGRVAICEVQAEIADVQIILNQLKHMYGVEEVEIFRKQKLLRLIHRLKKEEGV